MFLLIQDAKDAMTEDNQETISKELLKVNVANMNKKDVDTCASVIKTIADDMKSDISDSVSYTLVTHGYTSTQYKNLAAFAHPILDKS